MSIFAELRRGIETSGAAETKLLAQRFAHALQPDNTLALHGDLGVGKTTFVQGLGEGLGIQEAITSPTYNIFTLHRATKQTLIHLDAYRLEGARQMDGLMLEDFLISPYLLAIEWPERIAEWLPQKTLHLRFAILKTGRHRIILERE